MPLLEAENERMLHECLMCEVNFKSERELIAHEERHEACGLEGCTFMASAEVTYFSFFLKFRLKKNTKVLQEHILMLHASGLYARMRHMDSEKDINEWREERKK